MKKFALIFLLIALMLASFTACEALDMFLPGGEGEGGEGGEGEGGGDQPPEKEYVKVSYKFNDETVYTINVEKGTAMTEAQVAEQDDILHNGYGFAGWYCDALCQNIFDTSAVLVENVSVYGDRGNIAGENVTWEYISDTNTLSLSGHGPMFDFKYNNDAPWILYASVITNIEIEEGITTIGSNSFYDFNKITNVHLPDGIERIGNTSFYRSSVSDINFPDSLRSIGRYAFNECRQLTKLEFNEGLLLIEDGAFYKCSNVGYVVLTDKIIELGNSAFFECFGIRSAYYVGTKEQYESVTKRLDNFWIDVLTNTYFLSDEEPQERGPYWYRDEQGEIKQWYYTIGFYASYDAKKPFTRDYVDVETGITQDNLDFINNIVYRGYKFKSWNGTRISLGKVLTGDIVLIGNRGNICGDNMTYAVNGTTLTISGTGRMWDFAGSRDAPWFGRNILEVVFDGNIQYIGQNAFGMMASMKKIYIPVSVTEINTLAFSGCTGLKYIFYLGGASDLAAATGITRFDEANLAVLYANSTSASEGEGSFFKEMTFDGTTYTVAWTLNNGVLTVGTDDDVIINFSAFTNTPWSANASSITKVVVRDGITTVGHNSFSGISGLDDIELPDTVNRISASAFVGTSYYSNSDNWSGGGLYISNHLIKVDPSKCGNSFMIKRGTVSIAEKAFENCSSITNLFISKDVIGIYSTGLEGLTAIEKVYYDGDMNAYEAFASRNSTAIGKIPSFDVYLYSKNAPSTEGKWWHYDTDGITIIEWPAVQPEGENE